MVVQQQYLGRLLSRYLTIAQQVAEFLVVALVVYALGRLLLVAGITWVLERSRLDDTVGSAVKSVTHLTVIAVAILFGAGVAGFRGQLGGSTILAAGITLAIGLAAQDVLSNFVAGAFIVQDPDLQVGDTIRWNDTEGLIRDIDLRVTRVQTVANETILVPNSELATSAVTNLTSEQPQAITHEFGISYDEDVDAAIDAITGAARHLPRVRTVPSPSARVIALEKTSVVLRASIWLDRHHRSQRADVSSAFLRRVHDRCRRAGVDLSERSHHAVDGTLTFIDEDSPARE